MQFENSHPSILRPLGESTCCLEKKAVSWKVSIVSSLALDVLTQVMMLRLDYHAV